MSQQEASGALWLRAVITNVESDLVQYPEMVSVTVRLTVNNLHEGIARRKLRFAAKGPLAFSLATVEKSHQGFSWENVTVGIQDNLAVQGAKVVDGFTLMVEPSRQATIDVTILVAGKLWAEIKNRPILLVAFDRDIVECRPLDSENAGGKSSN